MLVPLLLGAGALYLIYASMSGGSAPAETVVDKSKDKGGTTTNTGAGVECMTPEAAKLHSLTQYQQALIKAKTLEATTGSGKSSADGDCGPMTRAAIKEFQAEQKLPATGTIDAATAWQLETFMTVDTGGGERAPVTYQMARSKDYGVEDSPAEFIILNPTDDTHYIAAFDATKQPDGFFKITKVLYQNTVALPTPIIPGFDRGWLWVKDSTGTWVSTS